MESWSDSVREAAVLSLLLTIGLVLHSVERMVPVPQVAPGIKLGLANTASLIGLFCLPYSRVLVMVVLRSLVTSLLGGGPTGFLFSVSGGIASATSMYVAVTYGYRALSLVSVSVIGALVHNLCQFAVAQAVTGAPRLYIYLPVLMVSGAVTGFITGVISHGILSRLASADALKRVFKMELYERFFVSSDKEA
ncbi:MAG: Gx transporter family protein [Bacillota bacterium]|nr:Gx transporter family protein [Bacillota bacterium]HOB90657.1 Gx transporter family protein [Bacillota bacterium]HPZ53498.1 Gx transporter family protein [Bacillota bacterium]HQD19149.1 Gx transporter family protein [Bacillota bacterium]